MNEAKDLAIVVGVALLGIVAVAVLTALTLGWDGVILGAIGAGAYWAFKFFGG